MEFPFITNNFDLPILHWIADNLQCGFLDGFMKFITLFGEAGIFWIATALVCLFLRKTHKTGLAMGIALLIGLVVCNLVLKKIIQRPRPYDYELAHFGVIIQLKISGLGDFSFPSGHTIACVECATVLMLSNKKFGIPAAILAVLVAFSRLYLYVHYPTDVITSVVLGIGNGCLSWYIAGKVYPLYAEKLNHLYDKRHA